MKHNLITEPINLGVLNIKAITLTLEDAKQYDNKGYNIGIYNITKVIIPKSRAVNWTNYPPLKSHLSELYTPDQTELNVYVLWLTNNCAENIPHETIPHIITCIADIPCYLPNSTNSY